MDQFPTNQFRLLGVHPHYFILKWCRQQVTDAIIWYRKFILTLKVLMKWNLLKTINELSIIQKEKKWNLRMCFPDHLPSERKFVNFEHECLKKMLALERNKHPAPPPKASFQSKSTVQSMDAYMSFWKEHKYFFSPDQWHLVFQFSIF